AGTAGQDWSRIEDEPKAFPAQTQPAPDPVMTAISDIEALTTSPFARSSLKSWKTILDRPQLDDIDAFQRLSDELRIYICEETGFYEHNGHPTPPDWLTEELMAFLEARFGWSQSRARDPFVEDLTSWLIRLRPLVKYSWDNSPASTDRRRRRRRRNRQRRDPNAPPPAPQSKVYSTGPPPLWRKLLRAAWWIFRVWLVIYLIARFLAAVGS
ncbi:MAG: hypothetical protein RLN72_10985, partial [Henriciella sp.]